MTLISCFFPSFVKQFEKSSVLYKQWMYTVWIKIFVLYDYFRLVFSIICVSIMHTRSSTGARKYV